MLKVPYVPRICTWIILLTYCEQESAVKLVGLLILWMALYINTSVKLASRVLKALLFMKVLSLVLIVAGGVYWMAAKGTDNLKDPFKGLKSVCFLACVVGK